MANDYLVISDLHLGYEEALNYQGVMVPKFQYPLLTNRLEEVLFQQKAEALLSMAILNMNLGRLAARSE